MNADVRSGTVDDALSNGRALLDAHPEFALEQARTLLRADPALPDAHRLAAEACRRLGRADDAEAAEMEAIRSSLSLGQLKDAARAEHEGRSGEASRIAAEHLRKSPDDLLAMTISAEAAMALKHYGDAARLLGVVHARAPSFLRATILLARTLMMLQRTDEAAAIMADVVAGRPDDRMAKQLLAKIESDRGDYDAAATIHEALLADSVNDASQWVNYGDALRFLGRSSDSALAYRRAIGVERGSGPAWWSFAGLSPEAVTDRDVAAIETALLDRADQPEHAGHLHFALGAVRDARGEPGAAFDHLARGNAMRLAAQPYDPDVLTAELVRIRSAITPEMLADRAEAPATGGPIFMIGMPRSGSTLVERILDRHSAIEGVGELAVIPSMIEEWNAVLGTAGPYREVIGALPADRLESLGARYRDLAERRRRTDKPFYIDKLHMNWRHLGMIRMILPDAPIIDVRRNAMDCCWSNYKLLFAHGHPASNDLVHIARFYRDYAETVDHFAAAAPGRMLHVDYEAVVDDIETETRRMLAFLGLSYEADCLDFHQSRRPVATASSEQVRRPLNRRGIGASRAYAEWLGPLREALGPLAP